MTAGTDTRADSRVLLLAPTRRDAEVTSGLLRRVGLDCAVCGTVLGLIAEAESGAGAVLTTEQALTGGGVGPLVDFLNAQPSWSELPLVILMPGGAEAPTAARALHTYNNVTLLERPAPMRSLVSAVQAAVRGRLRQYQIRDQIQQIRHEEEMVRQSAQRYRRLVELSPDAIFVNISGFVAFVNPAMVAMFGAASESQLIGQPVARLMGAGGREQAVDRVRASPGSPGSAVPVEQKWVRLDGAMIDVEVIAASIPWLDAQATQVILRDIGGRRQAEEVKERLAAIVNSSDDAIIGKGLDGVITSWNAGAQRIFGYTAAEAIGRHIQFLLPPERLAEEEAILARLRRGERVDHFETRRVTKEGRTIDVSLTISPIRDGTGRIIGASKIARDITERRKSERQLRELNATLEQRVTERTAEVNRRVAQLQVLAGELTKAERRERSRLAGVLHNDLQQLLVAARLRLGLVEGTPPEEARQEIDRIQQTLGQAIATSRSLTTELSPPILHGANFAAALEWLSRWMFEQHTLRVEVHADTSADAGSDDLRAFLLDAAKEVLFNVVKHAKVAQAAVWLARISDDAVELRVEDAGRGYDPRGGPEPRQAAGGFGLFSIGERLELLGGKLVVDSAVGRGTRVRMIVPLRRRVEPPVVPEVVGEEQSLPAPPETPTTKVRVLVADDHKIVREGLVGLLSRQPDIVVVGEAADGHAAVEMARRLRPDLVLMDINMPGLDGIEATRRIRSHPNAAGVIGLSMHNNPEMAEALRRVGAAGYLPKDSPVRAVIAAIHEFGGGRAPAETKTGAAGEARRLPGEE